MSPWSAWGVCTSTVCGVGKQVRERYATVMPLDGGRACPELDEGMEYQKRPCPVPCGHHSWQISSWSDCSPVSRPQYPHYPSCGSGLQSRTVRCVYQPPESQPVEVGEENCDPLTLPENTNYCHLPCRGECVMSPWSHWSSCPPPCTKNTSRTRERSLLRTASHDKKPCPHAVEKEPCFLGNNCFTYVWEWSEWGPCTLGERATCGHGQRQRVPTCRRNDGRGVAVDLCAKFIPGSSNQKTQEVCVVPCAEDCVMSEWTNWETCSATCGAGVQQRQRQMIHKPSNRGRLCPLDLVQYRPCVYISCNRWRFRPWSPCQIQTGACGHGVRQRELWCQSSDGARLDNLYCQHLHKPAEPVKEACEIQCAGDCVLSEWLSWGPCHKPCGQNLTEGIQTRARLILKHPSLTGQPCQELLQTRPCSTRLCHRFHWATSEWMGQHREVWCQRNDGLRTYGQGGCDESIKPSSHRECPSSCQQIRSAFCTGGGQCVCREGLTPIYSQNRLEECAVMPTQGAGQIMTMSEKPRTTNKINYLHEEGRSNFWMYAVIGTACFLAIIVAIAVYRIRRNEPSGPRPKMNSGDVSATCTYSPVTNKVVITQVEQLDKDG